MNQDQLNAFIRTACTLAAASLGFTASQTTALLSGATGVAGLVFLGISLYGSWKANSTKGKLASVDAMGVVQQVKLAPTPEGVALAAERSEKVAVVG